MKLAYSLKLSASIVPIVLLLANAALAGSGNSLLDVSADGKLLACSNRDSGTVTIVDLAKREKLHEVPVGKHPEGVSFLGQSHELAVAVYADDRVAIVDGDAGKVTRQIDVFDEPYGIVSTKDGGRIYVTLDYPGQVLEVDPATGKAVRTFDAGKFTRGIALAGDESRVLVTEYYTGAVIAIEIASGKLVDQWPAATNDNLARQITLHPSRPKAYVPHIRSKVTAVHGEGSIFPYVSVVTTDAQAEKRRTRIPMDAFLGNLVTANPWEVAVSPDGSQATVVFAGTDDMFVCNVLDDNYRELSNRQYVRIGKNPRAVRYSPDGQLLFIYTALDFQVVAFDARSLSKQFAIDVTQFPGSEEVLLGKILFYSANQPMASRRWISCSSCHPDGDPDGKTWHNPEGLRNTQALFGMAWTHPIHWSADRDEVQDFEYTIRGNLMQGRGLLSGSLNKELGDPNRGRSRELDALAAYANSHEFKLSPHAKGGLSEAAKRGKEIFFSAETKCATCHGGPLYSDSQPGPTPPKHDVGTGGDDRGEKMGPEYDTPSLLGAYRTAPYLHHGKAATLEELLTSCNKDDRHGKTSHLSAEQVGDLAAFLKSLPYEDPVPAAKAAGLKQVEP
jgi:YVTN family beta-propeller protein